MHAQFDTTDTFEFAALLENKEIQAPGSILHSPKEHRLIRNSILKHIISCLVKQMDLIDEINGQMEWTVKNKQTNWIHLIESMILETSIIFKKIFAFLIVSNNIEI